MSVELYPNVADLDEKLSALEDAELAQRILSANPELFGSAAAREEVSVFAAAWKRFGALALAVTAALAIGAGYVFMPHAAVRPAIKPMAPRITVREKAPAVGQIEKLVVHPPRRQATAPSPASASVAAPAAVAAPVHHTVAYHHPAAASHAAAPAAHAAAAPSAASGAGAQAEAPIQYESNAQVVSSANAPPTDAVPPNGTKSGIVAPSGGDTSVQAVIDSCTPQGGRLAAITQRN
jgi:hypothetical protein